MADLRRAAQWYARRCCFAVFACAARSKTPATPNGCNDATTDPATIDRMWSREPQLNVAIECGRSGIVVVDVDGEIGGRSLADLERQHGAMPITPEVHTASGRHLYLRSADGVRNSASKLAPGIDTRAAGGYVLAPPSVHPSGHVYRWASGRGIHEIPLGQLPAWIVDAFREPEHNAEPIDLRVSHEALQRYGMAALRGEVEAVLAAPTGTRNHRLNAAAFAVGQLVGAGALRESIALGALIEAGRRAGLGIREVLLTCNSGVTAGMKQPRRLAS